ncbi:hypothetical protein NDU88_003736 [Pleurodeles waltl]|uniref:Uncharacterized protein n=1 Tax=Pleurodeles waltl TaxID=8319 RepID=A0AAV7UDJ0_PLEWA|nr:hypothetical protein NDU88_003736 [Pleurodeles waltl]
MDLVSTVNVAVALSIPSNLQLTANISCSMRSIVAPCMSSAMLARGAEGPLLGGVSAGGGLQRIVVVELFYPLVFLSPCLWALRASPIQVGIEEVSGCDVADVCRSISRINVPGIQA